MRFFYVNELKLTQLELFSLFRFNSVAVNLFELFIWPCKQIKKAFYTILTFHFKSQILYKCKLASLS